MWLSKVSDPSLKKNPKKWYDDRQDVHVPQFDDRIDRIRRKKMNLNFYYL